jgi:hypothetical protein
MDLFQKLSGRAFRHYTHEGWEALMCNFRTAERPGVNWVVRLHAAVLCRQGGDANDCLGAEQTAGAHYLEAESARGGSCRGAGSSQSLRESHGAKCYDAFLLTDTLSDPVSTDAGRSFVQHLAKNIRLNSWDWEDGV